MRRFTAPSMRQARYALVGSHHGDRHGARATGRSSGSMIVGSSAGTAPDDARPRRVVVITDDVLTLEDGRARHPGLAHRRGARRRAGGRPRHDVARCATCPPRAFSVESADRSRFVASWSDGATSPSCRVTSCTTSPSCAGSDEGDALRPLRPSAPRGARAHPGRRRARTLRQRRQHRGHSGGATGPGRLLRLRQRQAARPVARVPGRAGKGQPRTYEADPTLRSLIDVVPFGLPDDPPVHTRPVAARGGARASGPMTTS